jgi:hypothetical protein
MVLRDAALGCVAGMTGVGLGKWFEPGAEADCFPSATFGI